MKKLKIMLIVVFTAFILFGGNNGTSVAYAQTAENQSVPTEELLDKLDVSALEEYFNSLSNDQKEVFGGNLKEFLNRSLNGDPLEYESFFGYFFETVGIKIKNLLPLILSIVAVAILISIISGLKGSFASTSVDSVVSFAGLSVVAALVILQVFSLVKRVSSAIISLKRQMEAVFPIIFTLMSALGASTSIAVYQPAVALLAFVVSTIITTVVLPMILINIVFSVVGNLSANVKLNGAGKFFASATKWILGTSYFLFAAFLSLKGITASVYDNMSVRTAKFALSKYVPVIGGYLSEGFNLILAGTVLLKNSVGSCAIILLFVSVVPLFLEIILLSLALKLASALVEPFSNNSICGMLNGISSGVSLLVAVLLGIVFCYFVFLLLLVCGGNLVL